MVLCYTELVCLLRIFVQTDIRMPWEREARTDCFIDTIQCLTLQCFSIVVGGGLCLDFAFLACFLSGLFYMHTYIYISLDTCVRGLELQLSHLRNKWILLRLQTIVDLLARDRWNKEIMQVRPLMVASPSIKRQLAKVLKCLLITLHLRNIAIGVHLGHNLTAAMIIHSNVTPSGPEMVVHIPVEMVLTITTMVAGIRIAEVKIGTIIEILTVETITSILRELFLGQWGHLTKHRHHLMLPHLSLNRL